MSEHWRHDNRRRVAWLLGLSTLCAGGCASGFRPFPLKDPVTVDNDKQTVQQAPEEYYSSLLWDGADQIVFRPFAKFWAVRPGGEAVNVNALDEVPNSSWFTSRIGIGKVTPEQLRNGPCKNPLLDIKGPWTVIGAKPNGANPGFPIKAADGRRYMVKFDGVVQGPRPTAADVIGSKIYWAAGFDTPCNEVVFFDRSILRIDPKANAETPAGEKEPMTEKHLDVIFSKSVRLDDGRYRASASLFLSGKPVGPFRYSNVRADDPNDVVPHEDRRELRGSRLLAAWIGHEDTREQNTFDIWIERDGGGGYVQHNFLDFGDCFGSLWEPPGLGRRMGFSGYLGADYIATDFVTLGMIKRPWDTNRFSVTKAVLGYYQVDNFEPHKWRPGYENPAMDRMTERDAAWMARIVARFTPAHIDAVVAAGQVSDPVIEKELVRVIKGRRKKILARYLSVVSALAEPRVVETSGGASVCAKDLAVDSGVVPLRLRRYTARAWLTTDLRIEKSVVTRGADEVCASLPAIAGASVKTPKYVIVEITASTGSQPRAPLRVHLYHVGATAYRLVGVQRPYDDAPPR
jgi:hypothetical protein